MEFNEHDVSHLSPGEIKYQEDRFYEDLYPRLEPRELSREPRNHRLKKQFRRKYKKIHILVKKGVCTYDELNIGPLAYHTNATTS